MRYIARRLLHGLLLLVGVSVLSFVFAELAPGEQAAVESVQFSSHARRHFCFASHQL